MATELVYLNLGWPNIPCGRERWPACNLRYQRCVHTFGMCGAIQHCWEQVHVPVPRIPVQQPGPCRSWPRTSGAYNHNIFSLSLQHLKLDLCVDFSHSLKLLSFASLIFIWYLHMYLYILWVFYIAVFSKMSLNALTHFLLCAVTGFGPCRRYRRQGGALTLDRDRLQDRRGPMVVIDY